MEISQSYAQELARQVDELEAENKRLRDALEQIMHHAGFAWDIARAAMED